VVDDGEPSELGAAGTLSDVRLARADSQNQ